ncbi:hypothetical protein [Hydromonas duriensis]|uniref:Tail sheath protein n=1 Tax=Hydromonas duriensis TaxID=1527608 RepID=A0A4R6Y1Q8_9BURK|nr:hypothetical protein [Hydromonas duriensis]TDR30339.1 hypothetical protein DFR44_1228 [Hydromonas duriensis]
MQNIYQRRLVGQQSGVQVNMPVDKTDRILPEVGDQIVATVGCFTRGRIDRPFFVSADKLQRYLGQAQSMRRDARNETYIQLYEAMRAGAAGAVVSRLSSDEASNAHIVIAADTEAIHVTTNLALAGNWLLSIQMMDCINAGVYVDVSRGINNPQHVHLRIRERDKDSQGNDTNEGAMLYELEGSVVDGELDENNNSIFIGDVAHRFYGDWLQIQANPDVDPNIMNQRYAQRYGVPVVAFSDAGVVSVRNKSQAVAMLGKTNLKYRYLIAATADMTLVSELMSLAQDFNRKLFIEVSGLLSPEAAAAWLSNFNYSAQGGMYFDFNWSPLRRDDPTGVSGNVVFGTVGQKAGAACARNAITNGFGLSQLNQPIAGKDYFITGTRISQIYQLDDTDLALLAKARINPAIFSEYHDGSGYVWADSFSGAKKNGITKLASASEIMIWVQDMWGRFGKGLLQKPMEAAIDSMTKFSNEQLQAMDGSNWLTPSAQLNGQSFAFMVAPSERYPDDHIDTTIMLSIDGVVRVVNISTEVYSRH